MIDSHSNKKKLIDSAVNVWSLNKLSGNDLFFLHVFLVPSVTVFEGSITPPNQCVGMNHVAKSQTLTPVFHCEYEGCQQTFNEQHLLWLEWFLSLKMGPIIKSDYFNPGSIFGITSHESLACCAPIVLTSILIDTVWMITSKGKLSSSLHHSKRLKRI